MNSIRTLWIQNWMKFQNSCHSSKRRHSPKKLSPSTESKLSVSMKKMKIFVSNQECLAKMGVTRDQSVQSRSFNMDVAWQLLKFCICVISMVHFLAFEASGFREYTESIYFTSATISIAYIFLVFVWNMTDFFNFIDGWEKCAEQSMVGRCNLPYVK